MKFILTALITACLLTSCASSGRGIWLESGDGRDSGIWLENRTHETPERPMAVITVEPVTVKV